MGVHFCFLYVKTNWWIEMNEQVACLREKATENEEEVHSFL